MAFLYKYYIEVKKDLKISLKKVYRELYTIIDKTLRESLYNTLKDIYYSGNGCFEIKSYTSISNIQKRLIGKLLKKKISENSIYSNLYKGIRIKPSDMLMFVKLMEEGNKKFAYIELISADILEEDNINYKKRCENYANRFYYDKNKQINKKILYADTVIIETVELCGLDVLNGIFYNSNSPYFMINARYLDKQSVKYSQSLKKDILKLEECSELTSDDIDEFIYKKAEDSILVVDEYKRNLNFDEIKRIYCAIEIIPDKYKKTKFFKFNSEISLTVHNVGQALTTSLFAKNSKERILFFDFGWSRTGITESKNTIATYINNEVSNIDIYISHFHKDHFNLLFKSHGIRRNKLRVISTSEQANPSFIKLMNEIRIEGGSWCKLENEIEILIGKKYRIKVVKCDNIIDSPKTKISLEHQKGLIMLIYRLGELSKQYEVCALVPGDQNYDLINGIDDVLKQVRILVATHHGGTYCFNDYKIPQNHRKNHKIIYSTGRNNRYGHPLQIVCDAYRKAGWGDRDVIDMKNKNSDCDILL